MTTWHPRYQVHIIGLASYSLRHPKRCQGVNKFRDGCERKTGPLLGQSQPGTTHFPKGRDALSSGALLHEATPPVICLPWSRS